jgi:mono/diheme cytochrome c family protein
MARMAPSRMGVRGSSSRCATRFLVLVASVLLAACEETPPIEQLVDYARDVQPILSDRCFGCHGPDASTRAAGLRLDTFEDATADRGGGRFAIAPHDPDASVVLLRVAEADPATRMPPAPGLPLTEAEVATLRRWIAQGAPYGRHWAFEPIATFEDPGDSTRAIDALVQARLDAHGLTAAPRAEPAALLRRLSLDVRGLPPSPEELEAFLADPSDAAYEAQLDAWLASPAHAERLANDWLDYAGYGDSNGLHADDPRQAWPWRDWVIARFLENQPLDTMIVAQLAGDLLPDARPEDVLATHYLRLHPTTGEGGVDPEERRLQHSLHRARTVGNQLFGLTVHCATCHDHKYDPITQRDFYSLVACFDRVADQGLVTDVESEVPVIAATSPLWPARRSAIVARLVELDARLREDDVTRAEAAWLAALELGEPSFVEPTSVRVATASASRARVEESGEVRVFGDIAVGDTLTLWIEHGAPVRALRLELGSGRTANTPWATELTADREGPSGRTRVRLARAFFDDGTDASAVIDGLGTTGVELTTPRAITFVLAAPLELGAGETLVLRLDQRRGLGRVFGTARVRLSPDEAAVLSGPLRAALARTDRDDATRAALSGLFAEVASTTPVRELAAERAELSAELARGDTPVATRVMRDDDGGRRTHILLRGQWGQPGDRVRCAVPAALRIDHPVEIEDRLGLARFVVSDENPITARVLANHYFRFATGQSLVTTPEDWGTRGGTPEHRDLLDFLAGSLRARWDLRAYLRAIFLTDTYRRSSRATAEDVLADPHARLLARAGRRRLDAEVIRDQALAAAGLLVLVPGGPPAFVSHPDGLYEQMGDGLGGMTTYPIDRDPRQQHRRALYTFWRRSAPHPSLSLFDTPSRMHAVAAREETSTPTQALALWNDPHFVEAARTLAARARASHPADLDAQIVEIFGRVLARPPTAAELDALRAAHAEERAELESLGAEAGPILRVGESDVVTSDGVEEAALVLVARAVLSSSESITRE